MGSSGSSALAAHIHGYDIILLDVVLPKKNGFQVATELRREGRTAPLAFDRLKHVATIDARPIDLTQKELQVLAWASCSATGKLKNASRFAP